VVLWTCVSAPGADDQPWIGQPAPGFNLPSLSGAMVDLEDFRGKIVVLHFGAGW
jgi:hypothetical protein